MTVSGSYSWPASALPKINAGEAGFSLSESEAALVVTMVFIGNVVSPIPSGILMDWIGRRNAALVGVSFAVCSWVVLALWRVTYAVLAARFMCGFWAGFSQTVVVTMIGEMVDPKIRGSVGALLGLTFFIGGLYQSLAALVPYQQLIYLSSLPSITCMLGLLCIPETPYYYLQIGRREDARQSIIWLRGSCDDKDLDFLQAKVEQQLKENSSFMDIFKSQAGKKAFYIVQMSYILQRLSGMTFLYAYTTLIVPDSWVSAKTSFVLLAITWTIFAFLSTLVMESLGRKTWLAISCAGSGLFMGANMVWYYLRDKTVVDTSSTNWLPLTFLLLSGIFYPLGIVSVPSLLQSELYPVNLKSKCSALSVMSANIVSTLGTQFFYQINNNIGMYFNFVIMTAAPLVWLIFIFTVMIETRGKSLETIQDILNGRKSGTTAEENS